MMFSNMGLSFRCCFIAFFYHATVIFTRQNSLPCKCYASPLSFASDDAKVQEATGNATVNQKQANADLPREFIGSKKYERKLMAVSFVNGIFYSESDWQRAASILNDLFGDNVHAFYNPSSGSWMKDALGAGYHLIIRPNDLETAKKLAQHLQKILRMVGPDGRVLHLAHSGGAILTYLAAKNHLSFAERQQIDVVTFGGGRSLTRKYFGGGHLINYYSRNDPLVKIDRRAGSLIKLANPSENFAEVQDPKHNTTFIYLHGILNDPIYDHYMTGPTYVGALVHEARLFHQRLLTMKTAVVAQATFVRRVRKGTAQLTGMHHFWHNVRVDMSQSLRSFRKRSARATGMRGFFSGKMIVGDVEITSKELLECVTLSEKENEQNREEMQENNSRIRAYWRDFFPSTSNGTAVVSEKPADQQQLLKNTTALISEGNVQEISAAGKMEIKNASQAIHIESGETNSTSDDSMEVVTVNVKVEGNQQIFPEKNCELNSASDGGDLVRKIQPAPSQPSSWWKTYLGR